MATPTGFRVKRCPQDHLSYANCLVVSTHNPEIAKEKYALVNGKFPLKVIVTGDLRKNEIAFNSKQREWINTDIDRQDVDVKPFNVKSYIASMTVEIDYYNRRQPRKAPPNFDTEQLQKSFQEDFGSGSTTNVFSVGQLLTLQFKGIEKCPPLEGVILDIKLIDDSTTDGDKKKYGRLAANSIITFEKRPDSTIQLIGRNKGKSAQTAIISPDWDFKSMGIGGLDKEFSDIFRRAFASRVFPPELVEAMG
jgi:vesicle-fusing ATPase